MRHIPASITEVDAKALFQKRSLWARLIPQSKKHLPNLPRLECINFPYYLLEMEMQYSKGNSSVFVTVEAWSGAFAFFEQVNVLREENPAKGEIISPGLSAEDAQGIAQKEIVRSILHKRWRGEKPTPLGILHTECILYPLWLYYYEVRHGKISLNVRDAVVGEIVGNRTRNGILQAFIEKRKA